MTKNRPSNKHPVPRQIPQRLIEHGFWEISELSAPFAGMPYPTTEKARLIREHDEAMARWQADVVACKAGQKDHCAKQ